MAEGILAYKANRPEVSLDKSTGEPRVKLQIGDTHILWLTPKEARRIANEIYSLVDPAGAPFQGKLQGAKVSN